MRYTSLFAGLTLLLISSTHLPAADKTPDVRTVVVPRAQVWCGPSTADGLYPTNVLCQGERVQVMKELDSGWLAIRPPAGSFSWINERFVQQTVPKYPNNYVVSHEGNPVPVLIGSSEKKTKPTKMGTRLERGTQVRVIGRAMRDDEGTWLPIEAPEGELRYIRKEDVSKPRPVVNATVATAASVRKEPPPPPDGDILWRDAEKAERTGRIPEAISLYRQAADANLSVNPDRAGEAYRRARWLEQANTSTGSAFVPEGNTPTYPVPANQAGTNAVRLIGTASPGAVNGQLVSASTASTAWGTRSAGDYDHYVTGHLSRASRSVGGQRSYLLLNSREDPIWYVVAAPGIDLSSHVDRNVELWVYKSYDYDKRRWLLTVTHVRETR